MRVEHDVFLIAEKEFTHSHQVERTHIRMETTSTYTVRRFDVHDIETRKALR